MFVIDLDEKKPTESGVGWNCSISVNYIDNIQMIILIIIKEWTFSTGLSFAPDPTVVLFIFVFTLPDSIVDHYKISLIFFTGNNTGNECVLTNIKTDVKK